MLNQIVLVGRLVNEINLLTSENNGGNAEITLAVPRSFKNQDGVYETDYIPCILNGMVAKNTSEYCNKGDLIGVKGRIEGQDGKINIIAERVTFLSSKKKEEE